MSTLYRRLTDLPPGWLPELVGSARTTDEALAAGAHLDDLGYSLAEEARRRGRRLVAVAVAEEEAEALRTEPDGPVTRRLQELAARPTRSRYACRLAVSPTRLTLWWDGEPRAEVHQRSRSRRSARYTLDADVLAWVAAESARRGESQSDVVQGALRARMDGAR